MTSSDLPFQPAPEELLIKPSFSSGSSSDAGLAPLLLTVIELVRQLMEAQVIRRMEAGELSDRDLERAADSIRQLEEQVLKLCDFFDVDPADLNLDLGEFGTLLPKDNSYYPGESSANPSILELLDRLLHTGVVVEGDVNLGLADLNLIQAKLRLVLTSRPLSSSPAPTLREQASLGPAKDS
ncbi:MAG: gas vesicle protein K [Synechococcales cyanobacterium K44_A2020_017]|nr:gas vesicle protein K [Synechococcales cyanobacterium K32_A2020_035]MBF2096548.1 gas vesicle protein K [Synechococcales cyanobacterium K44_A2020_017]